jgi:hypothetical protein
MKTQNTIHVLLTTCSLVIVCKFHFREMSSTTQKLNKQFLVCVLCFFYALFILGGRFPINNFPIRFYQLKCFFFRIHPFDFISKNVGDVYYLQVKN